MALAPTPPPFPVQNSNFLEPCFVGSAALTSSANAQTLSGSLGGSFFGSGNAKKEKLNRTFNISSSLESSLSGSNILLLLNANTVDYSFNGTNYTQSLELQYLEATLTGSELSYCTSFFQSQI